MLRRMTRGMNLSRTSGAPNCVLIALCEGEHDYAFIKEVFKRIVPNTEVKELVPGRRDQIVSDIIDIKPPPYAPVIVEGGKGRLDKDIGVLISKLRSVPRSFTRVLILRDSDSNAVNNVFEDLKSKIEGKIESSFPASIGLMLARSRFMIVL